MADIERSKTPPRMEGRDAPTSSATGVDEGGMMHTLLYGVPLLAAVCVLSAGYLGARLAWVPVVAAVIAALAAALSGNRLRRFMRELRRERSSLDEQLFQSQKLAALGEMAAGIAHEINTPLAIIGQEAEWLGHLLQKSDEAGQKLPDDFRESLDQIDQQVQRCAGITHGILGFAAKRKALVQQTDLNKLTDDMVRWIEREAMHRNISIVKRYSADLPPVTTDQPLLRQVLLNLLNNAYQAVDHDGSITIRTFLRGVGTVCIEIQDSGPGISPENLKKIFNPFFTTKSPGKGTGLGLSISLAIITRLGGTLSADSKPGEGAAFTIALPVLGQASEGTP